MPIKKTKESTWYNSHPKAVIYTCSVCGDEYYTKYKGNDKKCMWCAIKEEQEIEKKHDTNSIADKKPKK